MTPVRVHILTDGCPDFTDNANGTFTVHNALIGKGFHWHSRRSLTFKGTPEVIDGKLIETIDIEDYISSVIASEMNPDAPEEFLKAHAVISRSWVLGKVLRVHADLSSNGKCHTPNRIIDWNDTADHSGFDICNDDHCQRYQGLPSSEKRLLAARNATDATKGLILADRDGIVADARFSKCCGGKTEIFSTCWQDTDPHYLRSFADPHCDLSDMTEDEKNAFLSSVLNDYDRNTDLSHWYREMSSEAIKMRLNKVCNTSFDSLLSITPVAISSAGRIREMRFTFANGEITVGKELMIRRIFSDTHLLSAYFTIARDGDRYILDGKGWGHGVGLCQIGAARMALTGASFREILSFYYPSAILKQI